MASVTNAHTASTQAAPAAVTTPTLSSNQGTPTSPVKKFPTSTTKISPKEEERKDESPASWRLGLRKTGSYGALAEITASKEAQKEKDTAGVIRSASSPRLSSSLDNKEKEKDNKGTRLAYVAPTIPRRLGSTSDIEEKENRESSNLRTSSSYTRRKWEDDLKKNSSINEGSTYHRSTSNRLWAEDSTEKEKDSAPTAATIPVAPTVVSAAASSTTALTTTTAGTLSSTSEVRERRRSYLTPVRDEESESQRKARSRQARQSRRSTQGVTLTDLQEAEKTIGRSRSTRTREQENEEKDKEEKEKQDKEKQEEKKESEVSREDEYKQKYSRTYDETYARYRPVSTSSSSTPSSSSLSTLGSSLYASSQLNRPNSLVGITSAYSRGLTKDNEREGEKKKRKKKGKISHNLNQSENDGDQEKNGGLLESPSGHKIVMKMSKSGSQTPRMAPARGTLRRILFPGMTAVPRHQAIGMTPCWVVLPHTVT